MKTERETPITTEEKALKINLQPSIYGVFAEIGAGQEVVNHFYRAGAASGTVAKSISAYDMSVSDSLYGRTKRYVSKDRLQSMLSIEYQTLIVNLSTKAPISHFFAFANTIEITNFEGTNKGRGWIGIKYQTAPNLSPQTCMIHVSFCIDDAALQKDIVGVLGVNLIYGIHEYKNDPEAFIDSLADNLNTTQFEIDYIHCSRDSFEGYDNKMLSFLLVKNGLTRLIMLDSNGEIIQPNSLVRKKDLLLIRGRFRPPTKVTVEMFNKTFKQMVRHLSYDAKNIELAAELTFRCYREDEEITLTDFLNRTELLTELDIPVMITNFKYHSELIKYFGEYGQLNSLNLVLGSDNLMKVFNAHKAHEKGGVIDFIHHLSMTNGKVFLFPQRSNENFLVGLDQLMMDSERKKLLEYMKESNLIWEVGNVNPKLLQIKSNAVISSINSGTDNWKTMVPNAILMRLMNGGMFLDKAGNN